MVDEEREYIRITHPIPKVGDDKKNKKLEREWIDLEFPLVTGDQLNHYRRSNEAVIKALNSKNKEFVVVKSEAAEIARQAGKEELMRYIKALDTKKSPYLVIKGEYCKKL